MNLYSSESKTAECHVSSASFSIAQQSLSNTSLKDEQQSEQCMKDEKCLCVYRQFTGKACAADLVHPFVKGFKNDCDNHAVAIVSSLTHRHPLHKGTYLSLQLSSL